MATTKIGRPGSRERRGATSALNAPRRRVHALAPEHVGELGSIAALAVSVLGVAVLIVGVTLIVQGITIGSRYDAGANGPPPDLAQLGRLPLLGGASLLVLGILMAAAPLALLADVRFSRVATILLALIGGVLAVLGLLAVISRPGGTADAARTSRASRRERTIRINVSPRAVPAQTMTSQGINGG